MDSMAHQWLREWVEKGGYWGYGTLAGVKSLILNDACSVSGNVEIFRDELRQLLADAEIGRKLRTRPRYVRRNMITGEREYSHTASFDVVIREEQE